MFDLLKQMSSITCTRIFTATELTHAISCVSTLHYVYTYLQREKDCKLGVIAKTQVECSGCVGHLTFINYYQ